MCPIAIIWIWDSYLGLLRFLWYGLFLCVCLCVGMGSFQMPICTIQFFSTLSSLVCSCGHVYTFFSSLLSHCGRQTYIFIAYIDIAILPNKIAMCLSNNAEGAKKKKCHWIMIAMIIKITIWWYYHQNVCYSMMARPLCEWWREVDSQILLHSNDKDRRRTKSQSMKILPIFTLVSSSSTSSLAFFGCLGVHFQDHSIWENPFQFCFLTSNEANLILNL